MRLPSIAIAIIMLVIFTVPASAQFTQSVYEFEDTIASMTYVGSWSTVTITGTVGGVVRTTSGAGASVAFDVVGQTLTIWRLMRTTGNSSRMNVCVGASCVLVINEATSTNNFWYPYTVTLPSGTQTITITQTLGQIYLDYFMILDDPSGSFPTPVPTATIVPSPTPASTTTPQPTPTPQPTATPYTLPESMIMIDPARSYSSVNGQIVAVGYEATAADIHIANLLMLLIFSAWGFFFFGVFVLVRYRK